MFLNSEQIKNYNMRGIDYKETMKEVTRKVVNNSSTDFKQVELALQNFINK